MELVTATVFAAGGDGNASRDQVLVQPKLGLLAVADGPTDTDAGKAAVRLVLDAVRGHIERHDDVLTRFRRHPDAELRMRVLGIVEEAFGRAAQEMFAFARRREGVWVTLDVTLLLDSEAFIGHVGEGRVYLVRRGLVHQLTVDQVPDDTVDEVFEEPTRDTADGAVPPRQAPMARMLGPEPRVHVESLCMELAPEDRFLVTSAHLVRAVPSSILHQRMTSEHLEALGDALAGDAGRSPALAACAQLGSGEPFTPDSAQARLALLEPMPLFSHCTHRELRVVAQATRPRRLSEGTVVFDQGQPGTELFLLVQGGVDIVKNDKTIATLGAGSNFGEMAMLDEPQRSARAVTTADSELLVIPRDAFFAMLKGNPMLAVKILWNLLLRLSSALRTTSERLAELEEDAR